MRTLSLLLLTCLTSVALAQTPLGTAFTYQGYLEETQAPADGPYDFVFRLHDAVAGGNQVGPSLSQDDVVVTDGVFTVQLDFGAAFGPDARWLAIEVRPGASGGAYTPLAPRQPVTATPVALFAMSGGDGLWTQSGTFLTNGAGTNFVGINRATRVTTTEYFGVQAPVSSGYGGMYIRTDGAEGAPFYGYAVPGQSMWTYFAGDTQSWHVYNDGHRLTVQNDGDVGIGTTLPDAKLEVTTTTGHGIHGSTTGASSYGVFGEGTTAGVRGSSGASNGNGVYGVSSGSAATGVRGDNSSSGAGVAGYCNLGTGVYGQSTGGGYAIYGSNGGSNSNGYAGYFNGRVHVAGTLSKASGSFKIDHPLDPTNRYLSHSFVESPDMMNIYNGNVTTGADGRAEVTMPEWFDALNRDFRYQLTAIGTFAQAIVEREMDGNRFVIRTEQPNVKVSWQVTGVRQDPWAQSHPILVEEDKPAGERGTYLHPEVYLTSHAGSGR